MPALDRFHNAVKNALIKDGWTVTDDPLSLKYGDKDLFVDLGAERLLSAERGSQKIAVEIKTFAGRSDITELHRAIGQYVVYETVLRRVDKERGLFLAVSQAVYDAVFSEAVGALLLEEHVTRLLIFDPESEVILRWRP